jgi:regulator of replication initiation timing
MHTELSKAKQTIEELVQEIANLQSELESTRQELSKAYEAARSYNNSKIDSFIDVAKDLESLSNQCQ